MNRQCTEEKMANKLNRKKKVSINEMQGKMKSYNFYNTGQFDSLKMLSTLFW